MLVLPEFRIDRENDNEDRAHGELNKIAAKASVEERVVQNIDGGEADHHRDGRAATGHEAAQAHDQSGQGEKLHADSGVGRDGVFACGVQKSGKANDRAAEHVGEKDRPLDVDAPVSSGLAVSAGRQDVPTEPGLPKHD